AAVVHRHRFLIAPPTRRVTDAVDSIATFRHFGTGLLIFAVTPPAAPVVRQALTSQRPTPTVEEPS
ncbi:MAG: hypothetical protein QM662_15330, partial [Gordonia sp. (in: high G+C Gram-positive bacteria)]